MYKYYVELDGTSIVMSEELLEKNDIIRLDEDGEFNSYRVREVDGNKLSLRLLKTLKDIEKGVRYEIEGEELFFENRLSKNQIIEVYDRLYKVVNIEKKTSILELEELDRKNVRAIYGVYESKSHLGLDVHDRESDNYLAEGYFYSKTKAMGYVMKERSKGRKVNL